ncbi:sporulation protein, partial [Bacillus haynesii]|nr:sporulation protein [Bacillus haynesii]
VRYVSSSDNRGAGSWVGNRLSGYADGTRILFIVQ